MQVIDRSIAINGRGLLLGLAVGWAAGLLGPQFLTPAFAPDRTDSRATVALSASLGSHLSPWEGELPSVWVEDLTWVELARGQRSGYLTVLIPTGGVEQGGPHLPTGKHNAILRYTAEEIARHHGRMVVAPILSYVPEQPHLAYPGTISVPEAVFQQVVEAAAESFLRQGYRHVVLMGDSGGNQASLRNAAATMQRRWSSAGRTVLWLDQYYSGHGQGDWLQSQGWQASEIGTHAGLADTAEFMAIRPAEVRHDPTIWDAKLPGFDGQPHRATAEMGWQLLEHKVQAAVRQLQRDLPNP